MDAGYPSSIVQGSITVASGLTIAVNACVTGTAVVANGVKAGSPCAIGLPTTWSGLTAITVTCWAYLDNRVNVTECCDGSLACVTTAQTFRWIVFNP